MKPRLVLNLEVKRGGNTVGWTVNREPAGLVSASTRSASYSDVLRQECASAGSSEGRTSPPFSSLTAAAAFL